MFKRILALALTILFICFKCLTWVPSAAATGIPAFDAFYYAILQTLGMAYTNGVEMDLAPAIAEVRENIPDYLQQPDNAVKYLLRDYAGQLWENSILQWSDSASDNVATYELSAIRLAGTEVSTPTLKDIVDQYQKKALDLDYQITTPIDTKAIAFWNKYDSTYINQYLDQVNYVDSDSDIPNPDVNYIDYLNTINARDTAYNHFYWYNYPSNSDFANGTYYLTSNISPFKAYSWVAVGSIDLNQSSFNTANSNTGIWANPINMLTINITSTAGGVYSYSVSTPYLGNIGYNTYNNWQFNGFEFKTYDFSYLNTYPWSGLSTGGYVGNYTASYTGSLDAVINHISQRFKNINIYVDGVLWSSTNDPVVSNFQSSVPNAVIDNSTDDGKIVSNPIYWTVDENTGTPIDAQINLDKLIDYLKGVIDGSNSDTSVDYGDLVDAGVIEKQDGTAITDANVIAVPVADAIDDALADNPAIAEPIVAIEDLPPLPDLPPFFPTPDFPEGDPTSGFHGMSVLARIINITNQSLPSEVVLVFYGVVFGAVILGLIKILHK